MELKNQSNVISTNKLKDGWTLVRHSYYHKDLDFIKKQVFIWPSLLKNQRIKYIIDHDFPSPSGEYNLLFTERYHNGQLHDVINIWLGDLMKDPESGIPSNGSIVPYPDWELRKFEDIDIASNQENSDIKEHYLHFPGHPDMGSNKFFRAEEDWANEEDYLKRERGEDVRNWYDWHQHSESTISYQRFYCWVKDTLLYYYIVPIYWELAVELKPDTTKEDKKLTGKKPKKELIFWIKHNMQELQIDIYNHEDHIFSIMKKEEQNLARDWEAKDDLIFKSDWRKREGWIPKEKLTRTRYLLDLGKITYNSRYYYRNLLDGTKEWAFLVDRALGLRKRYHYQKAVEKYITELHGRGLSNPEIRQRLMDRGLQPSLTTISRATNNQEVPNPQSSKKELSNNTLYSSHDDVFVKFRLPDKAIIKKRVWLISAYTGAKPTYNNRHHLLDKGVGLKILDRSKDRSSDDLHSFYQKHYYTNDLTKFEIATDACIKLKSITRGVPNSKWVLSKYHLTQPFFQCADRNKRRKYLSKTKKETMGYYQLLEGNPGKISNYDFGTKAHYLRKRLKTYLTTNREGIEAYKTAKYGYHAESLSSEVKKLLGNEKRIMTTKSFSNLLKLRGWYRLP